MVNNNDIDKTWTYLVIGLGKQVHFSHSINNVIRNITKPDAKKTRNLDSVLKYYSLLVKF